MRLFTKEQRDTIDVWHKEKTAGIVFLSKLIVNQVVHMASNHTTSARAGGIQLESVTQRRVVATENTNCKSLRN